MTPRRIIVANVCAILLCGGHLSVGDEKADRTRQAVLDSKQADADFQLQGEYSGTLNVDGDEQKWGAQVIALGEGSFRAQTYPGGLPGDGWSGNGKLTIEGATEDGVLKFAGDQAVGVCRDGNLAVEDFDGNELGVLEKVERTSPSLNQEPPAGAVVLFDGSSVEAFKGGKLSEEGWLEQGVTSHQSFGDFRLHLEFMLSYMPYARGQGRSNSGCYMQGRYEVQILDSFGLEGEDNECGGIYGVKSPDVNMCLPPLSWQTYDVDFKAARFEAGEKTANARMTVKHNGIVIHDDVEIPNATRAAPLREGPDDGPLYIQDHNNPLRFRNIWIVEKTAE